MKLIELDPKWLIKGGSRVGFTFRSPTNPEWRQSCFVENTPRREQWQLFEDEAGENFKIQGCRPDFAWTVSGGIAAANFETMTVTPSLDGSSGGLWHGFITNGQITGV